MPLPKRSSHRILLALALATTSSGAALAQNRPLAVLTVGEAWRACGGDAAHLCPDVAPGGGRLAQCLSARPHLLTPSCRDYIERNRAAYGALFACTGDAQRLCGSVAPGGGRLVLCLAGKRDSLTPECARALQDASAAFAR
jgi:hypothetical protein